MHSNPCIKGTRISGYFLLPKLAAKETAEKILAAYPQ